MQSLEPTQDPATSSWRFEHCSNCGDQLKIIAALFQQRTWDGLAGV